jgi:protoporphyrinogen oxidase
MGMSGAAARAIIIGAGPAGLTAAYELLKRAAAVPVVLEKSHAIGGISCTVCHNGNRIDIGGHRFFSKSDRVMKWWLDIMPLERGAAGQELIRYQNQTRAIENPGDGPDPEREDRVMLIRHRKSRIYFLRRFFDYPIKLSAGTLAKLGARRTLRIGFSYLWARMNPRRPETSLEDFLINRFGRELYLTFFKSYTEKVWGVPCHQISAEWGAQRIKSLSLAKTITHFLKKTLRPGEGLAQKGTETSLIEKFLYPKYGPGQLWECVAEDITSRGGSILTGWSVDRILTSNGRVAAIEAVNEAGERKRFEGDYFFSTMPIQDLVRALDCDVPAHVREISDGLQYRDFITVGLLLDKLKLSGEGGRKLLDDNWIYIQEPDVLVGRMQIFNNWSPYLVADPDKVWIGLEYFCSSTDELWKLPDEKMIALAIEEMQRIGIIDGAEVRDSTVIRMPKTYPAYLGTYSRFDELRAWLDKFPNLFLVGRNGMHKYNNQDHSMLTAMTAVDNIVAGIEDKANLWAVNTEMEYHEEK